jgi:uncharacterized membrane protein YkvA (DUF1232 family)
MSLKITFELSESDLKHFRKMMQEAKSAMSEAPDAVVISATKELLEEVTSAGSKAPEFLTDRMGSLQSMVGMLEDSEWKLPAPDRKRVISALAYFSEPEDLIPDHIPGLGFLDDAIMIELVVRELQHEIQAYDDFCRFRVTEEKRRKAKGQDEDVSRDEWLSSRRKTLHDRMRSRRQRDRKRGRSGARLRLF